MTKDLELRKNADGTFSFFLDNNVVSPYKIRKVLLQVPLSKLANTPKNLSLINHSTIILGKISAKTGRTLVTVLTCLFYIVGSSLIIFLLVTVYPILTEITTKYLILLQKGMRNHAFYKYLNEDFHSKVAGYLGCAAVDSTKTVTKPFIGKVAESLGTTTLQALSEASKYAFGYVIMNHPYIGLPLWFVSLTYHNFKKVT